MKCEQCNYLHTRIDESVSRPITTYSCTFNPEWLMIQHPDIHYCSQFKTQVINTDSIDFTNVKPMKRKKQ